MATTRKGVTQARLGCAGCSGTSGLELVGPPKFSYEKFDSVRGSEYRLEARFDAFCTNCDTYQHFIILEDNSGVQVGTVKANTTPEFTPLMDWPKRMESDAIVWSMELEGKNDSRT